ncbi:MAG TPA: hypothetical protein DCM51_03345 [Actinobacteria bacterium]|nr:hypothetical protein [Actinomycetota bacterium]
MSEQATTQHEHDEPVEDQLLPANIIDLVTFGRRLRAARIIAGYDRVNDLTAILRGRYGVDVSDRTVYAIERGEQMPHLDLFLAVVAILDPPGDHFLPAYRSDVAQLIASRYSR